MAGARIVDADPARHRQAGPQHVACFIKEGALALVQQPNDLALRDRDADSPELGYQTRHGHLALVVLEQHEPTQLRPDMTGDAGRHGCRDGHPVRGQPTLAAEANDVRPQHEILNEEVLVALEAGARWNGRLNGALLVDGEPLALAALGTASSRLVGQRGFSALVHAAGLHSGPALQALERRHLRP